METLNLFSIKLIDTNLTTSKGAFLIIGDSENGNSIIQNSI